MLVEFMPIHMNTKFPTKATEGSACYDAYAVGDITIQPRKVCVVPLGFAVAIPQGYELQVRPRSGLASKGILVANSPGCIDSDYRGQVCALVYNTNDEPFEVKQHDRICQLKLAIAPEIEWNYVKALGETNRGEGGFGSTGI